MENIVPDDGQVSTTSAKRLRSTMTRTRLGLSSRRSLPRQLRDVEKPYKCDVPGCSYSGEKSQYLKSHMKIHVTFSCIDCSTKFDNQELLEKHIHDEHGDEFLKNYKQAQLKEKQILIEKKQSKLYKCEKCPKKFKLRRNFIMHEKICTSEFLP